MAIKKIPEISGPSYGGVIYGLTINQQFSQSPSKLKLNIVNKTGKYSDVSLNTAQSVKFGSFNFKGTVWSSALNYSANESVLSVELIDNSIILDRTYVILWKRGLMGLNGAEITRSKTIELKDTILVPKYIQQGFSQIMVLEEKKLEDQVISRKSRSLKGGTRVGSAIVLGEEDFADSNCDIPDTYYYFNDLKNQFNFRFKNAPSDSSIKGTYEGTMREVLNNWCADLGYDYYWDFSDDSLVFYEVSRGITGRLPSTSAENLISINSTNSMEGTYRQYGVAFTQKPKSPVKELSFSKTLKSYTVVNPVHHSRFLSRSGSGGSFSGNDGGTSLGKRSVNSILTAGFVGYVSRSLRDLHCYKDAQYGALGIDISRNSTAPIDKKSLIDLLCKLGYFDTVKSLEEFDAPGLPNYTALLVNYDSAYADTIYDSEQELLTKIGKWYRIPSESRTSFYCTSTSVVEISTSVEPEGTVQEEDNEDFAGKKMYDRGGQISHDSAALQESLNLNSLAQDIQNCTPIIIDLKESGVDQYLIDANIIKENQFNSVVLFPSTRLLDKIRLSVNLGSGNNPMEKTWRQARDASGSSGRKECNDYETRLEQSECKSAEEEARERATRQAYPGVNQEPQELFSGLENATAHRCSIKVKGGGADFFGPSYGQLRVVTTTNIEAKKISNSNQSNQFLFSEGKPGEANDVSEIRVAIDNITSSSADEFRKKRTESFYRARDVVANSSTRTATYVFAGEPPSGFSMSPSDGLSGLDITLSSDGFTTTATFSSRGPKPPKNNSSLRSVNSQLNRASFNAQ
jgi:hypothetical protein